MYPYMNFIRRKAFIMASHLPKYGEPINLVDHLSRVLRDFRVKPGQTLALLIPDFRVPLMVYRLKSVGTIKVQKFSRWRCKNLFCTTVYFPMALVVVEHVENLEVEEEAISGEPKEKRIKM